MKFSGQITVDLSVRNYIEAADHLQRLEGLLKIIREAYPEAILAVRERRVRKPISLPRAEPRSGTGALNRYAQGD